MYFYFLNECSFRPQNYKLSRRLSTALVTQVFIDRLCLPGVLIDHLDNPIDSLRSILTTFGELTKSNTDLFEVKFMPILY